MIEIHNDGSITIADNANIDDLCAFVFDAVNGNFMRQLMPILSNIIQKERGVEELQLFLQDVTTLQDQAIASISSGPVIGPFDYGVIS